MLLSTYCMGCRKPVEPLDARVEVVPNPKGQRYAVKGTCPECGTKQHKFASKETYEQYQTEA